MPVKAQEPSRSPHPEGNHLRLTASQVVSAIGFTVLSTFCGVGLANLALGVVAICTPHVHDKWYGLNYITDHRYYLLVGGILGLFAGLAVSLKLAKADRARRTEFERKYVGPVGRTKIYLGAPFFFSVVLVWLLSEKIRFGTTTGTYLGLGIFLAVIAASLYLYDRIPPKYIVPIGVIGWLLAVALGVWHMLIKHML